MDENYNNLCRRQLEKEIIALANAISGEIAPPGKVRLPRSVSEQLQSWIKARNKDGGEYCSSDRRVLVKKLDGDQILHGNSDDKVVTRSLSSWLKIPESQLQEYTNYDSKKTSTSRNAKETRNKVQWLKQVRDYSFLSSDQHHDHAVLNINSKPKSRCSSVQEMGMKKKGNYSTKQVVPMMNREEALQSLRRKRKMDDQREDQIKGKSLSNDVVDQACGRKKARTTINKSRRLVNKCA